MRKNFKLVVTMMMILAMCFAGCGKKEEVKDDTVISVASLKGPTSMGLVELMDSNENEKSENTYEFNIYAAADEISGGIISGEIDIALIPANLASVLYNKTEGGITVLDINTLGVLYVVAHDDSVKEISDLSGKTIYMTGKGTTPEYALTYLLEKNGLSMDDVTVEFKSEATEVVAALAENSEAVAVLPQPFVTSAKAKDDTLNVVLDFTEEWDSVSDGESSLVTGVTVVSNTFLEEHSSLVETFLEEHAASAEYANENVEDAAALVEKYEIVGAAVAVNAIPECNIVCITGDEMKTKLSGYLNTLYEKSPESVGGTMPDEGFYYSK